MSPLSDLAFYDLSYSFIISGIELWVPRGAHSPSYFLNIFRALIPPVVLNNVSKKQVRVVNRVTRN